MALQYGGTTRIPKGKNTLALHDLTGFEGRCDAILFSTNHQVVPPNEGAAMQAFRKRQWGILKRHGSLVSTIWWLSAVVWPVVTAARNGCRVALIQNRSILGGNNSSEVRVGLSGLIHQEPYTRLGDLVDEIGPVGHWNLWQAKQSPDLPRSQEVFAIIEKNPEKKTHNAGPASNYEDQRKIDAAQAEKNLSLFLNTHVVGVEMDVDRITAVIAQDTRTGERRKFRARLIADCTGDGNLGAAAGADFRVGREAKSETDEGLAPEESDELVMGTSIQWNSVAEETPSEFPACPWAVHFDSETCSRTTRGDWNWETGTRRDQIGEIERIRDYALRVVYGNWAVLKNAPAFKDEFAQRRLNWVAYIGGKRESRRLLSDLILKQQDVVNAVPFLDASVTTTWTVDLHYPLKPRCACEPFRSESRHIKIKPYPIPYRCLYSRNVDKLMMAGRNISVTHVALGTVCVMRTTGMMGEVLGMAAGICKEHGCEPRDVYDNHLDQLKSMMQAGVPKAEKPRE